MRTVIAMEEIEITYTFSCPICKRLFIFYRHEMPDKTVSCKCGLIIRILKELDTKTRDMLKVPREG